MGLTITGSHNECIMNGCQALRLFMALDEIVKCCANTGRGNDIVDARIVERVEEIAMRAIEGDEAGVV